MIQVEANIEMMGFYLLVCYLDWDDGILSINSIDDKERNRAINSQNNSTTI